MERYEAYKGSGVEWLGEIPVGWEVKRFRYVFDLITDKAGDKLLKIGLENIESGSGKFIATDTEFEGDGIDFLPGDILFGKLRPYLAKVYLADFRGKAVGDFFVFRSKGEIKEQFGAKLISSKRFIDITDSSTYGSKMPRVSWDFISELLIAYPNIEEQTTIANFLDRKTAEIDALIAQKERLLELYEEEKTAIINHAVTKGLDPNTELKDSRVAWLGEIPVGWGIVSLKWKSSIYAGGTPDKERSEYWLDGTIPWLNSGAVNQFVITEPSDFITEEGFRNSSAKWIEKESIVVALAGQGKTKGMAALTTFRTTCNQSLSVIQPASDIDSGYLLYYLRTNYLNIRGLAGEGKRDGLNLEMIGSIPISVPPLEEQTTIANFLDRKMTEINGKIAKTQRIIELQKEYRTALISEVVTGKIKVPELPTQEASA